MKYKAYLRQMGSGCDYSISCGQMLFDIEASNIEEAKEKLTRIIIEDYSSYDNMLEIAVIYEVSGTFLIPVKEIYKEKKRLEEIERRRKIEIKERHEYERLKNKFSDENHY